MRSRLRTNIRKQNTKTIIGIIIIIILVVGFGTKFLIGFSVVLEKLKFSKEETASSQDLSYIAPPVLNPIPDATNKDKIDISGYTTSDENSVSLYVNGKSSGKTNIGSDKTFMFKNVILDQGDNEIKAKAATSEDKQSEYSSPINVKFVNKQPSLDIASVSDGQVYQKGLGTLKITGKTDPGVKVTVNDFWTINNSDGTFYYLHNLKDGDNHLKIVATDNAGNSTTKELTIKAE